MARIKSNNLSFDVVLWTVDDGWYIEITSVLKGGVLK
jgi:hypothetical protein